VKIIHWTLIIVFLLNIGCAGVPLKNTSSPEPEMDKKTEHKHQPSLVFKKYEKQQFNTILNLEGKAVTEFNYDDLNTFFEKNYVYPDKPYKLTPAEHAVVVGEDIFMKVCFVIAGLAVLGVVDKNWRPF
jgi:hypothetical protein